jgi:hypothetical protein
MVGNKSSQVGIVPEGDLEKSRRGSARKVPRLRLNLGHV